MNIKCTACGKDNKAQPNILVITTDAHMVVRHPLFITDGVTTKEIHARSDAWEMIADDLDWDETTHVYIRPGEDADEYAVKRWNIILYLLHYDSSKSDIPF